MKYIRQKLIEKIKEDTGIEIPKDSTFFRPTLNWAQKSVGQMIWYFYTKSGQCIGSCENMTDLLKSEKIQYMKTNSFDIDLSSD